ncbi:DUF4435 domain-containing protein [Cupriavidus sp. BIC8F]|uniref:DUF4435 domain-containing protein n=1 Tax=Cupriavidus sp. BIC8F TaxID=3079014 RepID=UPI002916CB2C|nr:DUF4435 domain-containing protein [Cupriavidus sp. BIC8F]
MSTFFQEWNDIDVYIEDHKKITQNIYVELINRIGGGKFKIDRVFPLGGRGAVIEKCKADSQADGRPRLYIIDGDLNLICGNPQSPLPRLYEHKVYCVENILVDESAVLEFLFEEFGNESRAQVARRVDFSAYEREASCLIELFAMYATLRVFAPTAQSVSLGLSDLLEYKPTPSISIAAVEARICKLFSDLIAVHDRSQVFDAYLEMLLRCDTVAAGINVVSGKDYLLTFLRHFMGRFAKIRCSAESYEIRLAKSCELGRHSEFVEAVKGAMGQAGIG